MSRLQQDIDDLDRMVDGNAAKDEIRSQIRLISRGVAALEAADHARLEQIARFSETNHIRHLTERHDMSLSQLVSAFENAKSFQDLHELIKVISKKSEACERLRLELMRTKFFDDINRSRTVLGLQPFEPPPRSNTPLAQSGTKLGTLTPRPQTPGRFGGNSLQETWKLGTLSFRSLPSNASARILYAILFQRRFSSVRKLFV